MSERKKPGVDIVNDVLEECIIAYPVSSFIISLYKQYRERGSLSKKQLQGLYGKASEIQDIAPGKLATLQAVINKMATRYKSDLPAAPRPLFEKDKVAGEIIGNILAKYPEHKRVLFLKSKYDNNEVLTPPEMMDLKRFQQVLK
jgi:hypothetical protein